MGSLKWKARYAVAGLAIAVLTLSGCGELLNAPTSDAVVVRRDGNKLIVVVCERMSVAEVMMEERHEPGSWRVFWESDVNTIVSSGQDVSPSKAIELDAAPAREPEMKAGDEIAVTLRGTSESQDVSLSGTFFVGRDGLSEQRWLHDDDSESVEPCS